MGIQSAVTLRQTARRSEVRAGRRTMWRCPVRGGAGCTRCTCSRPVSGTASLNSTRRSSSPCWRYMRNTRVSACVCLHACAPPPAALCMWSSGLLSFTVPDLSDLDAAFVHSQSKVCSCSQSIQSIQSMLPLFCRQNIPSALTVMFSVKRDFIKGGQL